MSREEQKRKRRWRSLAELGGEAGDFRDSLNEFAPEAAGPAEVPSDLVSRRRFMALVGASAALATATACSRVDRGAIVPYTKRPEDVVPGVADYYASTFQEGLDAYGVLVKTREGRPIHIEGNDEHPLSLGKTSPRAVADVLRLYDPDRLRQPLVDGKPAAWDRALGKILEALKGAKASGAPVLLMSGAIVSPTAKALLSDLKRALPSLEHVQWEPAVSPWGPAPGSRLERAEVIVSFEADFLSGEDPVAIRQFAARRMPPGPEGTMNRLWVLEGGVSLTGSKADHRLRLRPSLAGPIAFALARELNESHGLPMPRPGSPGDLLSSHPDHAAPGLEDVCRKAGLDPGLLRAMGRDLLRAGKAALVLAGPHLPPYAHAAVRMLNHMLGAEGSTVDYAQEPLAADLATPGKLAATLQKAASGGYAAGLFWQANPAYTAPDDGLWRAASAKLPMKARIGLHADETALECSVVLPENHWLESWGDFEPAAGLLSLQQPCSRPLYDTRQGEEILLDLWKALGGSGPADYHAYLKARWRGEVYPAGTAVPFERFWSAVLHDGVVKRGARPAAQNLPAPPWQPPEAPGAFELLLKPDPKVYDGRYANSGWLQELPDPITKATWGNPLSISVADARRLSLKDGDVVKVTAGQVSLEAPVIVQPGQADGVLSLSLGYGRRTGSVATGVGVNAYPLLSSSAGSAPGRGITVTPAGRKAPVPTTQTHHRMEGRDLVRCWSLDEYAKRSGETPEKTGASTLYPDQEFPEHKWGMAIDLSVCVGCAGCMVACQSENNVPVVGPEQVARGREMHWLRVDRYYEGTPDEPRIVHQPMLCQQCDDAPCENVCPVNATNHSPDGLNQMTYNRCVGTRYCANNCPYKVRRFNFLEFNATKGEPESLAFNPEVTVRPRGVMEKCTFCIQRIEDAKLRAKGERRPIADGEIAPACADACPAGAIVFGDLKDPGSRVSKLSKSDRGYRVLEELGVRPSVTYLADLRNPVGEEKT